VDFALCHFDQFKDRLKLLRHAVLSEHETESIDKAFESANQNIHELVELASKHQDQMLFYEP
jgi:hypothetical protein